MLKSGIWGLAVYLAVLAYGFKIALQHKDVLFISFMLLVAIVSLSENILDMDKGVFFYGFFFSFFLFSNEECFKNKVPLLRGRAKESAAAGVC